MKIYRNVLYWSVFGTVTIGGAMYVWGTEDMHMKTHILRVLLALSTLRACARAHTHT